MQESLPGCSSYRLGYFKKKPQSICSAAIGGDVGIRTPAPAEPTYRISNPDPSTTWVHLHLYSQPSYYISGTRKNQGFLSHKNSTSRRTWNFYQSGNYCSFFFSTKTTTARAAQLITAMAMMELEEEVSVTISSTAKVSAVVSGA